MSSHLADNGGRPLHILPVIVVAQFAATSAWFAGNAVLGDLEMSLSLPEIAVGPMTSTVQFGFIVGTLIFAAFGIADRFSPRLVFLISSLAAALCNLAMTVATGLAPILILRVLVGVSLAGIYPVGMKIASGWYRQGLGAALGWLVGALVFGTALPHGVRYLGADFQWQQVLIVVSIVTASGGVLLYSLVPDGPYLKRAGTFRPRILLELFAEPRFRAAAFGYFGHMWELYAVWTLLPLLVTAAGISGSATSGWSFMIIAVGFLGCGFGGLISLRRGSAFVARAMLATSGSLCVLSPLLFAAPPAIILAGLLIWGFAIVGDSPQFSTLIARNAAPERVGTAFTLINSIGFAITIPSIELLTRASVAWSPQLALLLLAPGPLLGLYASGALKR